MCFAVQLAHVFHAATAAFILRWQLLHAFCGEAAASFFLAVARVFGTAAAKWFSC
jgi:hypothetical protein